MTKVKTRKKIAVIGPVYPFKGGISHYTGLLVRALSERFKVRTVSYSMQYPKIRIIMDACDAFDLQKERSSE